MQRFRALTLHVRDGPCAESPTGQGRKTHTRAMDTRALSQCPGFWLIGGGGGGARGSLCLLEKDAEDWVSPFLGGPKFAHQEGRCRSMLGRSRPSSAEFCTESANLGPALAEVGASEPGPGSWRCVRSGAGFRGDADVDGPEPLRRIGPGLKPRQLRRGTPSREVRNTLLGSDGAPVLGPCFGTNPNVGAQRTEFRCAPPLRSGRCATLPKQRSGV